jgi:two-component system KDP operon response regulator KdpE
MQKVLIVEDEKKLRDYYRKALQAEGLEVLEAEDGEQATYMLLQDRQIDLFLLDLKLPVVRGSKFFEAVKVFSPNAKIVVSSVYPLDTQRQMVEGADDYFEKSEGTDVLVTKVKKALQSWPAI